MKLKPINEVQESNLMMPTVEWMREKYNQMNASLFDGKLGDCSFEIFKTGKGSQGHTLGLFRMAGKGLKYSRRTRVLYKETWDGKIYIDASNFAELSKPLIMLNGNYKWTEKAALSTLVHEMCHYYCHRNGYMPTRSHGYEFQAIAARVSAKSKDFFTVQQIASAEQMDEMELDANVKARNDKRIENKLNKIIPTFVFNKNGSVHLINANGINVIRAVINFERDNKRNDVKSIKICRNEELKKFLFSKGYKSSMTTYRYWDITNKTETLNTINSYDMEEVYTEEDNKYFKR